MGIVMPNPVEENRLGRFLIDTKFFEKEPDLVMRVMGKCIITEAQNHYYSNSIEYFAFSPEFERIENAVNPPYYNIEAWRDEEGRILFKFIKLESELNNSVTKLRSITY